MPFDFRFKRFFSISFFGFSLPALLQLALILLLALLSLALWLPSKVGPQDGLLLLLALLLVTLLLALLLLAQLMLAILLRCCC